MFLLVHNNEIQYFFIFENFIFSDHQWGEGKREESEPKTHQPVHTITLQQYIMCS